MSNTIVHPTDFSKCANDALDYAIEMAKILDCKIDIVHSLVYDGELNLPQSAHTMLAVTEELEKTAELKLNALEEKVMANNIECTASIFSAKIVSWLPDYIANSKPLLVVMGTTGANSMSNKIFGSNTYSVIKNSIAPVLAVPESAQLTGPLKNFVFSTDYRNRDIEALQFLIRLARPSEAKIDVVHILNSEASKKVNNQTLIDNLEQKVKEKDDYARINYELLHSEDPMTRLSSLLEEKEPDLLTLVMRKQGFFERLFFGSLTEKLVHRSKVPLLIFAAD